jgi:hypothetical protein
MHISYFTKNHFCMTKSNFDEKCRSKNRRDDFESDFENDDEKKKMKKKDLKMFYIVEIIFELKLISLLRRWRRRLFECLNEWFFVCYRCFVKIWKTQWKKTKQKNAWSKWKNEMFREIWCENEKKNFSLFVCVSLKFEKFDEKQNKKMRDLLKR